MNLPLIGPEKFRELICQKVNLIDVRSPVEFKAGSLPNSVNFPILNDQERTEIGTLYKQAGQAAAIARGHELVTGTVKEVRVAAWIQFVQKNPETVLTCFRGGLRSQLSQAWLAEAGYVRPRLQGGYKSFRNFLITELENLSKREMVVISGPTGSGKTLLIHEAMKFRPTVDLEKYAGHKGSAFGRNILGQPSQIDFENHLSSQLIQIDSSQDPRLLVVEDESRMIGHCVQPQTFFDSLRSSGIVFLDEPLSSRVEVTYDDYISNTAIGRGINEKGRILFDFYLSALQQISRKLGGLLYSEVEQDLLAAKKAYEEKFDLELNRVWIGKLLAHYYDPLYLKSLDRRQPRILFRGLRKDALEFLQQHP